MDYNQTIAGAFLRYCNVKKKKKRKEIRTVRDETNTARLGNDVLHRLDLHVASISASASR